MNDKEQLQQELNNFVEKVFKKFSKEKETKDINTQVQLFLMYV